MSKLYLFLFFLYIFYSCSKETVDTTSQRVLQFSTDTLTFDTVFQTLGSATRTFKIYNHTSQIIFISKTSLNRGANSQFRYNIDGLSGSQAQNIRILPNDSLWVFAEVTVNPNPSNPLLVTDSLIMESNGGRQVIVMKAFGQNAYFHYGEVLSVSQYWPNDKPHVILDKKTTGGIIPGVIVPVGVTLTIQEGAQLHFSNNAGLVVQGTIHANGTKSNPILMRGLRLERDYLHAAGQWLGILIERNSRGNTMDYTTIDEAAFGVWMGYQSQTNFAQMTNATRADIYLKNTTIKNSYYWVIRSLNNTVKADNCQFFTSTDYMLQLMLGGEYIFRNCTMFNIQSKDQKANLVLANQFYDDNTRTKYKNPLAINTAFENCIFYSSTDESIVLDINDTFNTNADYVFKNCNYNSKANLTSSSFVNCIRNQNPLFESMIVDKENLKIKSSSPCIDKGIPNDLTIDIMGNPRPNGGGVDIGAYEY